MADARFVANLLANAGIPATLDNTARPGFGGSTGLNHGACGVVVRVQDLPRALPIAEEFERRRLARGGPQPLK